MRACFIGLTTFESRYYQPSLEPTVLMALFSKAARSAMPARVMIAWVTVLGAGRFGARTLTNLLAIPPLRGRPLTILLAAICGVIAWCSQTDLTGSFRLCASCLTATAAILSADLLTGNLQTQQSRRLD